MSWLASLWAWIAEHPITVIALVAGLAMIVFLVVWLRRQRRRDDALSVQSRLGERLEHSEAHVEELARRLEHLKRTPPRESPDPEVFASTIPTGKAPSTDLGELSDGQQDARSAVLPSFASERSRRPDPSTPQGALEIEAGRLAYQIPNRMWRGVREIVEVRLGPLLAPEFMHGFIGRGDIKLEHVPIVETMSVSLLSEPGAFDIESRSQEVQLVKPGVLKGTAFHQADFAKWVWLVTPRETGEHALLVKVSAAMKDSRGLPTTAALPDKIIAVTVRVHLVRATVGALGRVAPGLAWAIITALVGVFTKDYWWPAVRAMVGMQ